MRSRLFTLFTLAAVSLLIGGCGSSRESDGATTVAATPEAIARATAFVGADRCGGCHETMHTGWAGTAHTQKLRNGSLEVNYANDGDSSGRADFFGAAEFDLGIESSGIEKFGAYGTDAPKLGSDSGGAYIKLGAAKYYVTYTLGGSGVDTVGAEDGLVHNDEAKWKQRYITTIGASNYILPVQFNVKDASYTTYDTGYWYDEANADALIEPAKNNSYERRCAGCHVTGLEVALVGDEWTMDFSDLSVSCEACHGPGGQHASSPNKSNIINPATMTTDKDLNGDGVVDQLDNLTVRNYVCFNCHSRGAGKHSEGGTTLSYGSKTGSDGKAQLYMPGLDWAEYYDITTTESKYWGGTPDSGDYIASKSHHQQQQDFMSGPHAPDKSYDHECFVCHDMHSTANDAMVASEMVADGITIKVDTEIRDNGATDNRNNLCLSCHAGHGDFEALSVVDVSSGATNVEVVSKAHMAKRAAKSRALTTKTMFSCTSCHMPNTAKSAAWTKVGTGVLDADGNEIMEVTKGDVAGHMLTIVWPSLSVTNAGLPNACNSCHNGDTIDSLTGETKLPSVSNKTAGTAILRDWANSGHGNENGAAWKYYDWDEGDAATEAGSRQSCQQCHTATGAMNFFTDPATYDAANNEFGLPEGKNQVMYCYGCHSATPQPDGFGTLPHAPGAIELSYTVDAVNPTLPDLGSSNICASCHAGRGNMDSLVAPADVDPLADMSALKPGFGPGTTNATKTHYLAAAGTVFQAATRSGYEYPGQTYTPGYFRHDDIGTPAEAGTGTSGPCASCHMQTTGAASHSFDVVEKDADGVISAVNSNACAACHTGKYGAALLPPGMIGTDFTFADPAPAVTTTLRPVTPADIDAGAAFLQTEAEGYHGALAAVEAGLLANGITFSSSYPYFSGDSWVNQGVFGAAHNYNYLHHEPGAYAHNRQYVKALIYDSIDWLDNFILDESVILDETADAHAIHWFEGDAVTGVTARP